MAGDYSPITEMVDATSKLGIVSLVTAFSLAILWGIYQFRRARLAAPIDHPDITFLPDPIDTTPAPPTIVFEGIPSLSDQVLRDALADIDPKEIALALTGASQVFKNKIFANLSEKQVDLCRSALSDGHSLEEIVAARQQIEQAVYSCQRDLA